MAYDVFISYSRKDTEITNVIEQELKKYGITCFVDRSAIDLGNDFAEDISQAISECQVLLFVWSENSNNSANTANEIALAIEFEKTIISFKIGTFKPHYRLAYRLVRYNRIDTATFNLPQIKELAAKVANFLGKKKKPEFGGGPAQEPEAEEPKQAPAEDFDPEMDADYERGVKALREFKISKAFEILYPLALAEYRDSMEVLLRIPRLKTRLFKLTPQQKEMVMRDADNGIPLAQYIASRIAYFVDGNSEASLDYIQKAADANLPVALGELGYIYDIGRGVEQDHAKYLEYQKRAMDMHDTNTIIEYARNCEHGWTIERDIDRGRQILEDELRKGHPEAAWRLGFLYSNNDANCYDPKKAAEYYMQAIDMGVMEAYSDLAYAKGCDCYGNFTDTKAYFEILFKGAEYEECNCMSSLALAYYYGQGVKTSVRQAIRWAERAAKAGDAFSYYLLAQIYYYGRDEIKADEPRAWDYLMRGRAIINMTCSEMLGDICNDGYQPEGYTKEDCIKFYQEAYELGAHDTCGVKLYNIYNEGRYGEPDKEKAMQYLLKAVEKNHPAACRIYGMLLTDEESDMCDEFRGVRYLRKAVDANDGEAILALGELYRKGFGVPLDIEKGKELVRRAADDCKYGRAQITMAEILMHLDFNNDWYDAEADKALSAEQISSDRLEALNYAISAVENGYNYAYQLIRNICWELSAEKDYKDQAINKTWFEWQQKAAEHDASENYALAFMYQFGVGTRVDFGKALSLYVLDFNEGNSRSARAIANIYASAGQNGMAEEWLQKAIDLGDDEARQMLDKLRRDGKLD